jgi:Tol biopolymer transport system component
VEALSPSPARPARRLHLTPFDRLVWLLLAALWLATGLLIVRGDQVGVQVTMVSPAGGAVAVSNQTPIRVTFDQPIELSGVLRSIIVDPPVGGTAQWEGETLVFYPTEPLLPDTLYTVTIPAGLRGQGGQSVQRAFQWQFRTGHPRVLFLAEDSRGYYQIMLADPFAPDRAPIPLINEPHGVWDYAPSPDGATIAYAAIREDGGSDLYAVSPDGGNRRQLLACPEAACSGPAWHPDGQRLIYERRAAGALGAGQGLSRLWWLDLAGGETVPVFDDTQWLGYGAAISSDGQWLSHVAPHKLALQIYNLLDGRSLEIPNEMGEPGVWNPRGDLLLYMDIVAQAANYHTHVFRVNVESGSAVDLSGEDTLGDSAPAWSPDGREIALSRRTPDSPVAGQVWVMPASGGDGRFLYGGEGQHQTALSWSPDGRLLLSQRIPLRGLDQTEIWLQDVSNGEERQVGVGAWPRWLP